LVPHIFKAVANFWRGGETAGAVAKFSRDPKGTPAKRERAMEINTRKVEVPKPVTCEIVGNEAKATFGREELRCYLANTSDIFLWVEDAEGNRAPMRVEFLRETLV
jgi:hypothetical protein